MSRPRINPDAPQTAAMRSAAVYRRAAMTLPKIPLDAGDADRVQAEIARTGETKADLVRRALRALLEPTTS